MNPPVRLARYGSAETFGLAADLTAVYLASHLDQQHDPWYSPDRFWHRFEQLYAPLPGFELVAGWAGDHLVGYAFGTPHTQPRQVWDAATQVFPHLVSHPVGVYLFREFAVHPDHQGKGYGRAIHDALLADRPEAVASLLVRVGNPVKDMYQSWGWRVIGRRQPFADSPVMEEMARPLPCRRG